MADSAGMLEVIGLQAYPAQIRAQAVHNADDPRSPWTIMVAPADIDLWVCWLDTEDLAAFRGGVSFDDGQTTILLRLAILFGDKWTDLWDDFDALLETQMRVLDAVTPNTIARALTVPLDELMDWRETMEAIPPTQGELLRREILGVKPIQGRN